MTSNEQDIRETRCSIAVSDAFQFFGLEHVARVTSHPSELVLSRLIGKLAVKCPQTAEEAVVIIWREIVDLMLCSADQQGTPPTAPSGHASRRCPIHGLYCPSASNR